MTRLLAAAVLLVASPALAQEPAPPKPQSGGGEWIEFTNRADRFTINFPGQPTVRDAMWESQRDDGLPAHVYGVQAGQSRYTLTVVDLAGVAQASDVKGSIAWEAWNFRKRGGKVTYDGYAQSDRIEGHELHIENPDRTRTFAGIYMHARKLYILEATGPPNSPGAVHFLQSLIVLDDTGRRIRYELDADGNRLKRTTNFGDQ